MIEEIKSLISSLCKGQEDVWQEHILLVVKYSKSLAKQLGADEEICEIAAWLHDIKKLKGEKEEHHIRGSEEAGEILQKLGYPTDKIAKVKECILTHSSDERYPPLTLESKIVASADAMSHFDNLAGLAYVGFNMKRLNREEGRKWLIEKYGKSWKKLMPEAKNIIKPKYDAIKILLGDK